MNQQDARWLRRFNNFDKAFAQLREAVELSRQRELSKLEQQGLNQAFEYTHELACDEGFPGRARRAKHLWL
jgi:hypothetical protein